MDHRRYGKRPPEEPEGGGALFLVGIFFMLGIAVWALAIRELIDIFQCLTANW